jgi:putative acetyltransferase
MSKVQIRAGRADEIERIYAVHRDSVTALCGSHYTEEQLRGWLAGRSASMYLPAIEGGRLWVAEDAGREVCGFVEIDGDELTKLFIRGARAGSGVGRLLLERAVAAISATGAAKAVLEATVNARDFYARHGFVETGRGEFSHGAGGAPLQIVKMERALVG